MTKMSRLYFVFLLEINKNDVVKIENQCKIVNLTKKLKLYKIDKKLGDNKSRENCH